ncbi:non-hydrolyzing UDP-N-acetylglucosamine 2-epimerase [Thermosediminibacter oceani]|uniref:UDP-N-acetylglucosamine 2-epimerase (non-hydrolyzing) n=1 Tax=Thermosediminibacter oceani (strain ATCC BAA-1034 / DSM 16646 / JW/IW-1228P) TaxID=555079 RepID=D9S000_THEOJ|nr:UDP-N-acetylglucosamine 2-epimerase (non-hydrolyzing) [Thermosediminibacter oceani]ADL08777.1 UDP-N-Acetylglucosamine 2-epimerase [Thermosediminibacter oceani DSM 16646]
MKKIKALTVFGTRPEAVKMAPLVQELKKTNLIDCEVAVTAQHRQMLDQVLSLFDVVPDYDLDIMEDRQTLFDITQRALIGLKEVLEKSKPDLVLVHGDTTTTFVGALASFYMHIKVGHVEAGLRTHNKWLPFPEEMNRKLTGALSDLHFAPTMTARENLIREGVDPKSIFVTGNTVIDALKTTVKKDYVFNEPVLNTLDFKKNRVILVTAHRRENLGQPLKDICCGLLDVVNRNPDVVLVYPVHLNPAVWDTAHEILGNHERIILLSPLDTDELHNLMARCYMVLTDSGGLQEEAPSLGKPVLVLRNETERPEAVKAGTVKVIGTARENVLREAEVLLSDEDEYARMANAVNPYGDGFASRRIVESILYYFGLSDKRPEEFRPEM